MKKFIFGLMIFGTIIQSAAAISFTYSGANAKEVGVNHFETTFNSTMGFTPAQIQNAINLSGEMSSNIVIDNVTRSGNLYTVTGHLKNYSISKNKLFNPWWNTSWSYRVDNHIANGTRPYQISLNISNSTGTNNGTFVFCNGSCNLNFSDIRFTMDNTTELPYWFENFTTGKLWVNVTGNGTVNMYYGNPSLTTTSNGNITFIQYHGNTSGDFRDPVIVSIPFIYQTKARGISAGTSQNHFGVGDNVAYTGNSITVMQGQIGGQTHDFYTLINGTQYYVQTSPAWVQNEWKYIKITAINNTFATADTIGYSQQQPTSASPYYVPIVLMGLKHFDYSGDSEQEYSFIRNYASSEPVWATWGGINQILNITDWGNNITNNQSLNLVYSNLSESWKVIHFNITTNDVPDAWNWTLNNVSQGVNSNSYDHNFTSNGSYYINVSVYDADSITRYKNWTLNLTLGSFAEPPTPYNNSQIDKKIDEASDNGLIFGLSGGFLVALLIIGWKKRS